MQEIYCNECGHYIRFKTKPEKSGNLILVCNHCGHRHCRTVKDGIVTDDRWDALNDNNVDPRWSAGSDNSIWREEQLKKLRK